MAGKPEFFLRFAEGSVAKIGITGVVLAARQGDLATMDAAIFGAAHERQPPGTFVAVEKHHHSTEPGVGGNEFVAAANGRRHLHLHVDPRQRLLKADSQKIIQIHAANIGCPDL